MIDRKAAVWLKDMTVKAVSTLFITFKSLAYNEDEANVTIYTKTMVKIVLV